jgi:hypothetical protein
VLLFFAVFFPLKDTSAESTKAIVCAEATSHSTTIFRFIYSYNFKVLAMFHILMTLDYAQCLLVSNGNDAAEKKIHP